jgi:hypothetical protein
MIYAETKDQYWSLLENLKVGEGILTIDFKENITLGRGPRELGWERRTIFGMVLFRREEDDSISEWLI